MHALRNTSGLCTILMVCSQFRQFACKLACNRKKTCAACMHSMQVGCNCTHLRATCNQHPKLHSSSMQAPPVFLRLQASLHAIPKIDCILRSTGIVLDPLVSAGGLVLPHCLRLRHEFVYRRYILLFWSSQAPPVEIKIYKYGFRSRLAEAKTEL